jgi:hypothetical protein
VFPILKLGEIWQGLIDNEFGDAHFASFGGSWPVMMPLNFARGYLSKQQIHEVFSICNRPKLGLQMC